MAVRGEVDLFGAPSADWLGVPLKIRGETVGVLAVQSYVPTSRYVESEKKILTFVSAITIIPAGHIGVVYGFGGGKIVGSIDNGTHFIAPWR